MAYITAIKPSEKKDNENANRQRNDDPGNKEQVGSFCKMEAS